MNSSIQFLLSVSLLFMPALASAADSCNDDHKARVKMCTQETEPGLNLAACLGDARELKKSCKNDDGTSSQCISDCENNHAASIAQCDVSHNVDNCAPGDTFCEDFIGGANQACKDTADFELTSCSDACI